MQIGTLLTSSQSQNAPTHPVPACVIVWVGEFGLITLDPTKPTCVGPCIDEDVLVICRNVRLCARIRKLSGFPYTRVETEIDLHLVKKSWYPVNAGVPADFDQMKNCFSRPDAKTPSEDEWWWTLDVNGVDNPVYLCLVKKVSTKYPNVKYISYFLNLWYKSDFINVESLVGSWLVKDLKMFGEVSECVEQ